ncbi:MAG: NADH-quinone oxidoreductase subunit C, partial [Saezia sp.]
MMAASTANEIEKTAAWQNQDHQADPVIAELRERFGAENFTLQSTRMGMPVLWVDRSKLKEMVIFLKQLRQPYSMLYDLHGVDERLRSHRENLPPADFSVFYHLLSIERNRDIVLKVALSADDLEVPSITSIFLNANWYEREIWDLFGIHVSGH